jgi:hypothetical protein
MTVPNVSAAVEARDVEINCCDCNCLPVGLSKYLPKMRDESTSPIKSITPTSPPLPAPKIAKLSILKPK